MEQGCFFRQIVDLKEKFDQAPALPFARVLSQDRLLALLDELKIVYRERIYTPSVTLWTFLSQVLHPDQSCNAAVARLLAYRVANGLPPCSADNSSYCQARLKLPEPLLQRLVRDTGADIHGQAPTHWHWHGRPVKVVDGSTASMPDTFENARAFGKPTNQQGCTGFPVARFVALFSLATGAVLDVAIGPYSGKNTGELTLFRSMQVGLTAGDILLGDRLFCTYYDLARLQRQGVDAVFRLHAQRRADFRRGRRLGHDDHVVTWTKPTRRPDWLDPDEFATLPETLLLREVRVRVTKPGCRAKTIIVVTTLTDPAKYSRQDIAKLFLQRWHCELDLRSVKTVMQMDVLRCLSPAMVRKEIAMHLLAYNLLRSVMCAAAQEHDVPVRQLSFKGTEQLLQALLLLLVSAKPEHLQPLCTILLQAATDHRVGNRPDRYEPRKRKRSAKPYPRLKLPRWQERKRCAQNEVD